MAAPAQARRGLLFVIASPSGAGKSTLTRLLLENEANIGLSVSVTTRQRRPSEVDGIHYRFVDRADYERMVAGGDLLEHAEVHGNGYGTPRAPVEAHLAAGRDVLFDIDWQGTLQLYAKLRADIASVFILPPSIAELRQRLDRRAEDSRETIERRLRNARVEMEHWAEYDYVLVNADVDTTFRDLRCILAAERLKRERQTALGSMVERLRADIA